MDFACLRKDKDRRTDPGIVAIGVDELHPFFRIFFGQQPFMVLPGRKPDRHNKVTVANARFIAWYTVGI